MEPVFSIARGSVVTITPLNWVLAMHIFFDRNTGRKKFKIKQLFESNLSSIAILKALQALAFNHLTLDFYSKGNSNSQNVLALLPDILSNPQNLALKKMEIEFIS